MVDHHAMTQGGVADANQALLWLKEGNARYAAAKLERPNQSPEWRVAVAREQKPWAVIWGCIDSRVPPELVFDRGLGDLFVIRTAGQVIDTAGLASLEFAVQLGVKLVMVLGHQGCGAAQAAIATIHQNGRAGGHMDALVQAIKPAYDQVRDQPGDKVDNTVRSNIARQVAQLRGDEVLARAWQEEEIKIVGAWYDLEKGTVELIA